MAARFTFSAGSGRPFLPGYWSCRSPVWCRKSLVKSNRFTGIAWFHICVFAQVILKSALHHFGKPLPKGYRPPVLQSSAPRVAACAEERLSSTLSTIFLLGTVTKVFSSVRRRVLRRPIFSTVPWKHPLSQNPPRGKVYRKNNERTDEVLDAFFRGKGQGCRAYSKARYQLVHNIFPEQDVDQIPCAPMMSMMALKKSRKKMMNWLSVLSSVRSAFFFKDQRDEIYQAEEGSRSMVMTENDLDQRSAAACCRCIRIAGAVVRRMIFNSAGNIRWLLPMIKAVSSRKYSKGLKSSSHKFMLLNMRGPVPDQPEAKPRGKAFWIYTGG